MPLCVKRCKLRRCAALEPLVCFGRCAQENALETEQNIQAKSWSLGVLESWSLGVLESCSIGIAAAWLVAIHSNAKQACELRSADLDTLHVFTLLQPAPQVMN